MYDLTRRIGKVKSILVQRPGVDIVSLNFDEGDTVQAINYNKLTGKIKPGHMVVINTTAVELGLGTGGYHFIIFNLDNFAGVEECGEEKIQKSGHIMKMRYTPYQIRTMGVEEKKSPFHDKIDEFASLEGKPVVLIPLHSLLAPLVVVFKYYFPGQKLVYIMTEGGALPLELSQLVYDMVTGGFIDKTITVGHAFGGDIEAVNVFTGLIAASEIVKGDLIVVGMGPGIAGTDTYFGFSGVENAFINYAINVLEGKSLIVPRVSFAEQRDRHYILSHHTITLLERLIQKKVDVIFPDNKKVRKRLKKTNLEDKHNIIFYQICKIKKVLEKSGYDFHSMGRDFAADPMFFITGGLPVLRYRELLEE